MRKNEPDWNAIADRLMQECPSPSDFVAEAIEKLESGDIETRCDTAFQIVEAGGKVNWIAEINDLSFALPALCSSYAPSQDRQVRKSVMFAIQSVISRIWTFKLPLEDLYHTMEADTDDDAFAKCVVIQQVMANQTIPTLILALDDRELDVRTYAANALGFLESAARDAIPALLKARSARNFDRGNLFHWIALTLCGLSPKKTCREAIDDALRRIGY